MHGKVEKHQLVLRRQCHGVHLLLPYYDDCRNGHGVGYAHDICKTTTTTNISIIYTYAESLIILLFERKAHRRNYCAYFTTLFRSQERNTQYRSNDE